MMKKFNFTGLLLLLITLTTFGQNNPADRRLTTEEQAALEKSVPVNPAKTAVEVAVDPRLEHPQAQPGPTNWKQAEVLPLENREVPVVTQVGIVRGSDQASSKADQIQPEGAQSTEKPLNYRNINGPNTQPEGTQPKEKPLNYRDVNGPNNQPEGQKPK